MNIVHLYIIAIFILYGCNRTVETENESQHVYENFVTTNGYHVMDGEDTLRFLSWNIPNLNYVEDEMKFDSHNPYGLPNEYEIENALKTVKELGGQVVRMYTIPVRSKNLPSDAVTYVEGPNEFNEEAFKKLDLVLAKANEVGVRVIVPFLNNWQWFGGVPNYSDFRNKLPEEFWTDEQLWTDFQATVDHVLLRKNTITGTRYIDDKAIFCWESGNELENPYPWVARLAKHVKSIDTNHLFMDGYYAVDHKPFLPEVFDDPNIDLISSHHYEKSPLDMLANIKEKVEYIDGKKPYFIGEFGFISTAGMKMIVDYILEEPRIFGAMSWSIRHHHRDGGYYWHSEPAGGDVYKAFHYPGSEVGSEYDERDLLKMFRQAAFTIQGKPTPKVSIPEAPELLPIENYNTIVWRGSVGADFYEIHRKNKGDTQWEKIEAYSYEDRKPYFPGYTDMTSKIGKSYDYKVVAVNSSGKSDESNVISVDSVPYKVFIDHPAKSSKYIYGEEVKIERGSDRDYKEMLSRLKGTIGSSVVYNVSGDITNAEVYGFSLDKKSDLIFSVSKDGENYKLVDHIFEEYSLEDMLYDYKIPTTYQINDFTSQNSFLKIDFADTAYIGRIVIKYK